MCSTVPQIYTRAKLYTHKELALLETFIVEFHKKFYMPAIQKLEFKIPHVKILGTHQCGKELQE